MIPVQLDDRQARVGAITLPLERIRLRLLWRVADGDDEVPGHAYALDAGDDAVRIVGLKHGVIDKEGMLALLEVVDRRLGADEHRTWTTWRPPEENTELSGDLGALSELLRGRRLRVLDAATGQPPTTWRLPPESFLRAPVAAWARLLLTVDWRPTHDFPVGTIPTAVAERIVKRTGAQPYLVQLYAQLLVELLNDTDRRQAALEDLEGVERDVLDQAGYYFRNTWLRAPETAREVLAALARGESPEVGREARRWLRRRALIDDVGQLTIPVLGRFLIEEELAV